MQYRLQSAPMFYTPGIVAWAINGYKFKKDRPAMLRVIVDGYPGVTIAAAEALLSGKASYTIENDTVIFEA